MQPSCQANYMLGPCGQTPSCQDDPCADPCSSAPVALPPDNRCYQEIGAEMNGNALTIRVLKDRKKLVNDGDSGACCCTTDGCCGDAPPPTMTAIPEGPNPPALNFKVSSGL